MKLLKNLKKKQMSTGSKSKLQINKARLQVKIENNISVKYVR